VFSDPIDLDSAVFVTQRLGFEYRDAGHMHMERSGFQRQERGVEEGKRLVMEVGHAPMKIPGSPVSG
jgi:hypothetical protein